MSKLMLLIGILLIIISVPILVVGILDTDNGFVVNIVESIACKPPGKLVTETSNYSMVSGQRGESIHVYCEIEPGQRRNITEYFVLVLIGSFLIPFSLGMILTIGTSIAMARRRVNTFQSSMTDFFNTAQYEGSGQATVIDLRGGRGVTPEVQQILGNVLGGVMTAAAQGGRSGSLAERLAQLDEAYNKKLISKEEHEKVRQAILDSMDDGMV